MFVVAAAVVTVALVTAAAVDDDDATIVAAAVAAAEVDAAEYPKDETMAVAAETNPVHDYLSNDD